MYKPIFYSRSEIPEWLSGEERRLRAEYLETEEWEPHLTAINLARYRARYLEEWEPHLTAINLARYRARYLEEWEPHLTAINLARYRLG